MSEEYEESCMECGFNQSDNDEREQKEKQEVISEIVDDLGFHLGPNHPLTKKWMEKL